MMNQLVVNDILFDRLTLTPQTLAKTAIANRTAIEDTKTLWRYNNSQWEQLTEPPKENLVFADRDSFPAQGQEEVLYVDKETIYTWDSVNNVYTKMGALNWEPIS